MCGLLGGTGRIESRYLVALGCLSEDRGSDSAGVGWQVGDNLRVAKVAKNPLVAYPVDLAPAIRHAAKYHAPLIGHTRQATQGAVNARNAHPFLDEKSKIAWAHNGIIMNDADFGKFEVDSECLIGGIQKRDFSPYHGPIGLLWIEEGKLHAFRKGNPLYRGMKRGAVYLASEGPMLEAIGCHRIKALSEGFIYVWEGNRLAGTTRVPAYEYTRGAYTTCSYEIDAPPQWEGGRRIPNFRDGHNFFRYGAWHNHRDNVAWSNTCNACHPAGPKPLTPVALIPTRNGGIQDESKIERIEGEEARRMLDKENICMKCGTAPRDSASVWCAECLGVFEGYH